jgi:AsmA protein
MSRLLLIPLALILLLVLAAAVLVPLLLDKDTVLELAATALHEQTGATLTVDGDAKLSLFPTLAISLSEAAVTLPGKQQSDLRVRSLEIGVQLLPLLTGNIDIDTISLDGMVVRIESAQEQAGGEATRQADIAASSGATLAVPLALNVKRLIITDSRLESVESTSAAPTVLELVRLEASGLNLEQKPVPVTLHLRRPGEQVIDVNLDGDVSVNQQMQHINLDEVTVVIHGATAQSIKLQTSGSIDLSREVADLQLALELGETRAVGSLRYARTESPRIDTRLQMNLFDPALLALAGPEAAVTGQQAESADEDDSLPLDTLRLIDTRAVLSIEQARFGAHTVKDLQLNLHAVDGVIEVTELTGDLHGGRLDASATLNGQKSTAILETSGSISNLDIAAALDATNSKPVLTGTATLNWQLNSLGQSANELTTALYGPIKLTTEEVVLQGTSVEKLLCEAVALTNQEQLTAVFPATTRFETLTADIQIANGKAVLDPLRADLPQVELIGSGNFDLLNQDFVANFKARLSPELEQLDHACRVSKRLTAIDWPVDCTGSVGTEPTSWCRVDASKIIQDLTVNEGLEKLQKKASKLFDKLFNRGD